MNIEEERKTFEAFWSKEMNIEVMDLHRCEFPMVPVDFIQPYACHETQRGWLSWLAAKAHAAEMAKPVYTPEPYNGGWGVQDLQHKYWHTLQTKAQAIEEAKEQGYRVIEE